MLSVVCCHSLVATTELHVRTDYVALRNSVYSTEVEICCPFHNSSECPRWWSPLMTLHSVIICSTLKKKVHFSKIFNNQLTLEERVTFEEK